jgi:hypothetical protein
MNIDTATFMKHETDPSYRAADPNTKNPARIQP